jgi:hypothetical protein
MAKGRTFRLRNEQVRCPFCGERLETQTRVQTRSGQVRTLSADPGEMTRCRCGKMLEYGGRIGALTVHRASPERVRAFLKLANEAISHRKIPALIEHVHKFRRMPNDEHLSTSGVIRFRFELRS